MGCSASIGRYVTALLTVSVKRKVGSTRAVARPALDRFTALNFLCVERERPLAIP
jgi:hypothetical protein